MPDKKKLSEDEMIKNLARDYPEDVLDYIKPKVIVEYGKSWKIPRERILFFEEFHEIQKGQKYVWECDQCMIGMVVPGQFVNGYGEKISLDIKNLPKDICVIRII